jgi:hypothetical protein
VAGRVHEHAAVAEARRVVDGGGVDDQRAVALRCNQLHQLRPRRTGDEPRSGGCNTTSPLEAPPKALVDSGERTC